MMLCMGSSFYAGTALYLAAGLMGLAYFWRGSARILTSAVWFAGAGAILLAAALGFRWAVWGLVPMTTLTDSISLLVVFATAAIAILMRRPSLRPLAGFYLPPLSVLAAISAAAAHERLFSPPRELASIPLVLHVGLAFLAYALFLLAAMTSAAYLFQAQRIKRRNLKGLPRRLPSLEQLDHTLSRLVKIGYPLFVLTLVLGGFWAHAQHGLLGPRWWLAPKVLLSFALAVLYAVAYHRRRSGRLRGPKLAWLVFSGFSFVLAAYVVLTLLGLYTYNFWEAPA